MESVILNRVQQTSSRVKNVLEDSEKLLAELKARRAAAQVNNQPVALEDDTNEQGDQEYEADDESENNEVSNESEEVEVDLQLQDENSDDEDEEYTYSFFCCTTRRGVHRLLL